MILNRISLLCVWSSDDLMAVLVVVCAVGGVRWGAECPVFSLTSTYSLHIFPLLKTHTHKHTNTHTHTHTHLLYTQLPCRHHLPLTKAPASANMATRSAPDQTQIGLILSHIINPPIQGPNWMKPVALWSKNTALCLLNQQPNFVFNRAYLDGSRAVVV